MYVCLCNAYRESQVRDAISKSAGSGTTPTVEQLYARLGSHPRCGRCVSYVQDLMRNPGQEKRAETRAS